MSRIQNDKWSSAYHYAKELSLRTEKASRILQVDMSGVVGFFSDRSIINGDDLINSFEYNYYLNHDELSTYLVKYYIDYYSTYYASQIELPHSNNVIYQEARFLSKKNCKSLRFNTEDIVFTYPFVYQHPFAPIYGEWMLFKFRSIHDQH